jgi:AraC-like DNA-binding protein
MTPSLTILREHDSELGRVSLVRGVRGHEFNRTSCPHRQFWLMLGGEWSETTGGRFRRIRRGQAVHYVGRQPSRRVAETDFLAVSVRAHPASPRDAKPELHQSQIRALWRAAQAVQTHHEALPAALAELISNDQPGKGEVQDWLEHALHLLDQRDGPAMTLIELADAIGISPNHLSIEFTRRVGVNLKTYQWRQRLLRSLRTELPLGRAWPVGGFYDSSHFYRVVKAETGLSPRELESLLAAVP